MTIETLPRPLPVDLIDGPGGLLYILPRAPLTVEDCETLGALLAARAAAARTPSPTQEDPCQSPNA